MGRIIPDTVQYYSRRPMGWKSRLNR